MKRPLILIYCVVCILKLKGSSQKVELSQQVDGQGQATKGTTIQRKSGE